MIKGTPRVKCEHCAITHAKQVISRRASEGKSPRPFYRIAWDLFDFPEGYNGAQWLLVIKDEYSGKLFGYILTNKSGVQVMGAVVKFDHWVKRQYGLAICKIRHDNDTSVIPSWGESAYQRWCEEEGIDLENPPPDTKEPNGLAERAGQEAITRSIKMRIDAGLPEKLWPETTLVAIFLYNISPLKARGWYIPNEVLNSWFREYFR